MLACRGEWWQGRCSMGSPERRGWLRDSCPDHCWPLADEHHQVSENLLSEPSRLQCHKVSMSSLHALSTIGYLLTP